MAMGAMTWACLLLAVHAGEPDTFPMNQRGFQIPIRIKPESRSSIKEVVLFVSTNQGKSWEERARTTPDKEHFEFRALEDGVYWFSVAVVDMKGQQTPPDIYNAPVGQRVMVDTVRPDVRIQSADRDGDKVLVRWKVQEDHPDTTTLQMEYRAAEPATGTWTPVPIMPGKEEVTFTAPGPGALVLRVQMKDTAGNVGQADYSVAAASGVRPAGSPAGMLPTLEGDKPRGGPPQIAGTPQIAEGTPTPRKAHEDSESRGSGPGLATPGRFEGPGSSPLATSPTAGEPRGALPGVRIVNKRQVQLEFGVAKIGPSGLGNVDVYLTLDEGATWEKVRSEPITPTTSAEGKEGAITGSVTVQLDKEGLVYGYYLVVKSRAGLGRPAPKRGEPPQIRVEMDMTPPHVELYSPQPDTGRTDTLLLTWLVQDRNPGTAPVALEWAEQKEGPWYHIGPQEMSNTGRYAWQVSDKMPPRAYLRLTARDAAGNVAVAQTAQPIIIDLTMPEVQSVGVAGAPAK